MRDTCAVLTSLLLGVRDVRAPLAAGILWMTFGWLVIDLPTRAEVHEGGGLYAKFLELAEALPVGLLLGVGAVAAYLVGSLIESIRKALMRQTNWGGMTKAARYSIQIAVEEHLSAMTSRDERVSERVLRNQFGPVTAETGSNIAAWETYVMPLVDRVVYELPLVRMRLMGDHTDVVAEYDRRKLRRSFGLQSFRHC